MGNPHPYFELAHTLSVNQSIMLGINALFTYPLCPCCPGHPFVSLLINAERYTNADERKQKPDEKGNDKRK
jgi:hypothetical protein